MKTSMTTNEIEQSAADKVQRTAFRDLLEAAKGVIAGFDSGVFVVRNVDHDHEPGSTVKPIFDSFKKAVADNQRLTSAQESVGTTSGLRGDPDAQAISWRTGGRATSAARMA